MILVYKPSYRFDFITSLPMLLKKNDCNNSSDSWSTATNEHIRKKDLDETQTHISLPQIAGLTISAALSIELQAPVICRRPNLTI